MKALRLHIGFLAWLLVIASPSEAQTWQCPKCDTHNLDQDKTCTNCSWERPEDEKVRTTIELLMRMEQGVKPVASALASSFGSGDPELDQSLLRVDIKHCAELQTSS